jgi:hypothetical protein
MFLSLLRVSLAQVTPAAARSVVECTSWGFYWDEETLLNKPNPCWTLASIAGACFELNFSMCSSLVNFHFLSFVRLQITGCKLEPSEVPHQFPKSFVSKLSPVYFTKVSDGAFHSGLHYLSIRNLIGPLFLQPHFFCFSLKLKRNEKMAKCCCKGWSPPGWPDEFVKKTPKV